MNFYNPQRRAPVNIVPGLIGVILTMTMVMFTGDRASCANASAATWRLLIATPLSPRELTIGKVLPYVAIGLVQVTIVLGSGVLAVRRAGARLRARRLRRRARC